MKQDRYNFQVIIQNAGSFLIMNGIKLSNPNNDVQQIKENTITLCEKLIKQLKDYK